MQLLKLNRNAKRLGQIIAILGKYGLADWLRGIDYDWLQGRLTALDGTRLSKLSTHERIRLAMTELGPSFIKLGQILSTRADLVGPGLAAELARLQAGTLPDSAEVAAATVESEFGSPLAELFDEFEPAAFASASIGQVHGARLAGRDLVVKVQHRGIEGRVRQDMEILAGLAALAERHAPDLRPYRPIATAAEFQRTILAELDYVREQRNMMELRRNFATDETVHLPAALPRLSGKHVLTMERLHGVSLADADRLRDEGKDLDAFAQRGVDMYLNMVLRDGFYHADPHPGNLLYLEGGVVGLLDCGMVGRVDDALRDDLEDLLLASLASDGARMTELIVRLGSTPASLDRAALEADVAEFIAEFGSQPIREFDLSGALTRVTEMVREHGIILPARCSMLLKTLVMLEGTARKLSPDFSLAEALVPYQEEILRRRFSPRRLWRRVQRNYRDWDRLFEMLPRNLADVLGRVREGSFDVHVQHRRLDAIVNRLVLGLLCSALFVASSLLWSLAAPPRIAGISVLGAAGYVVASLMCYRLLRAIRRSG